MADTAHLVTILLEMIGATAAIAATVVTVVTVANVATVVIGETVDDHGLLDARTAMASRTPMPPVAAIEIANERTGTVAAVAVAVETENGGAVTEIAIGTVAADETTAATTAAPHDETATCLMIDEEEVVAPTDVVVTEAVIGTKTSLLRTAVAAATRHLKSESRHLT
jgi:hypothetical protein